MDSLQPSYVVDLAVASLSRHGIDVLKPVESVFLLVPRLVARKT